MNGLRRWLLGAGFRQRQSYASLIGFNNPRGDALHAIDLVVYADFSLLSLYIYIDDVRAAGMYSIST